MSEYTKQDQIKEDQDLAVDSVETDTDEAAIDTKKNKKKYIIIAVIAALIVITLLRVFGGGEKASSALSAEPVTYRDIEVSVSGTGTIAPIHSSVVAATVTGDILADYFQIGDVVEKDQLLYELDSENANTTLEQAKLAVEQAQLGMDQANRMAGDLTVKSTVSGQVSEILVKKGDSVAAGMPVATVTDRKNMLLKCDFNSADADAIRPGMDGVVTLTATGETVAAKVKNVSSFVAVGAGGTLVQSVELTVTNPGGITDGMAATAQVGSAACQRGGVFSYQTKTQVNAKASGTVEKILVSEGDAVNSGTGILTLDGGAINDQVRSAQLGVKNAELALRNAQDMMDNYRLEAQISGTITQKDLEAGDSVSQPGTMLAVVSDLSQLTFEMKIDELDIPKIKEGQEVHITVDALPGEEFTGYVERVSLNGMAANGVTSYPVRIMIDNPDEKLLPGMNVSADIMIESISHTLTVPMSAVGRGNMVKLVPEEAISLKDGSIDESMVREIEVAIGSNDSNYVQIVKGLEEGDRVLCAVSKHRDSGEDRTSEEK